VQAAARVISTGAGERCADDLGRSHLVKIDGVLYAFDAQSLKQSLHDISHFLKKQ
jgi:hypothetical protein